MSDKRVNVEYGTLTSKASKVVFDPSGTNLTQTNVQGAIEEVNSNLSSLKYTTSLSESLANAGWKSLGSYTIPSDGTYLVQLTDVKGVPQSKAIGGAVTFGDKWTKVYDNGAVASYTPSAHVCVVSACTSGDTVTFYANTTQSSAYTITAEVTVIKLF